MTYPNCPKCERCYLKETHRTFYGKRPSVVNWFCCGCYSAFWEWHHYNGDEHWSDYQICKYVCKICHRGYTSESAILGHEGMHKKGLINHGGYYTDKYLIKRWPHKVKDYLTLSDMCPWI